MALDFKVSPLGYKELKEYAQHLRVLGNIKPDVRTFDVVDLLHNTVIPALSQQGKTFSVQTDDFMENPAEVDLEHRVLYVADWVLIAAKSGDHRARLIVAHEIAHMVLHEDQVMAFSEDEAVQLNFLQAEESAERQAQDFALLLLLPDDVIVGTRNMSAEVASIITSVEPHLVEERRKDFEIQNRVFLRSYIDRKCPCGTETTVVFGAAAPCPSCGDFD